ncbi:uncharacterized protein C2orf72 homolog [Malurus melanocephalus]|uniref:uncharacterized protein C2orf72 homolog n=1 Tax=Malurus melanocephalus TaxID=175006 RepID=UPI00254710FE|nr:uncharacterized protein C2orf72 homolog [Malurus melanocephalus]
MAAAELQELRALVERAGGRRAVLLVAEVAEGAPAAPALAAFARDLLGDEAPRDAAVLDAALRRHFPAPGTVQAARYSPGSPGDCRAAACRALRAALQHPAEEMKDRERWRIPFFLQCISWNQRSWRKDHEAKAENNIHEDDLQDLEEEVALASLSPNGNCEEAAGGKGT